MSKELLKQVEQEYIERSQNSFSTFIQGLQILSAHGPQTFGQCIAPYQTRCFQDIEEGITALRSGLMPKHRRFWIERTKKASKDTDIAATILWLLAFPTKPIFLQVGAADKDQAAIVRRRMDAYVHYNPWMNDFLQVNKYDAHSKNGLATLEIVAADVAGSHGETPDLLVLNELSHVTKWEFIENLMDNATGVPRGVVLVATNAGYQGTKAWVWRKNAISSKDWTVHIWDIPGPWLTEADLQDAKKRNTPSRYARLYEGEWPSGKGDAFDSSVIDSCVKNRLEPLTKPEPGWHYILGMDLGISHDHAALVLLGVNTVEERLRVATYEWFEPGDDRKVDLIHVEERAEALATTFNVDWFGYDPYQAELMAQRLKRKGINVREVTFTGKNLTIMATALKATLEEALLETYPSPDNKIKNDLAKFSIVEKSYGLRLEAVSDEEGHADVGTALVIALPKALQMLNLNRFSQYDQLVYSEDATKEEIEAAPQELREIIGMNETRNTRSISSWEDNPIEV